MTEVGELAPGDEVLWGDRVEPLVVEEANIHVSGGVNKHEPVARQVKSQRGTTYRLIDNGFGDPKVYRVVTPGPDNPQGVVSEGYARNLRRVGDE